MSAQSRVSSEAVTKKLAHDCAAQTAGKGNIGIKDKKMEPTVVYRGNIGIMAKSMETAIVCRGGPGN